MAYTTELVAFPVKIGKEARAEEWMNILVQRQDECVATLEREAMHFESLFKSTLADRTYLSWFSVQGKAGEHVATSPFPIDKIHVEFWNECIDSTIPPITFQHIVNFLPPAVAEAIAERESAFAKDAP